MDHERRHEAAHPPTPPPPPPPRLSYSVEDSLPRTQAQRATAPPTQEYGSLSSSNATPISREDNESAATMTQNTIANQSRPPHNVQNSSTLRRPTSEGTILHPSSSSQERLVGSPSQSVSFHTPPRGQHEQLRSERMSRNIDGALPPLPRSAENLQNPLQGLRKASLRHSTAGEYHDEARRGPSRRGSGVDWIVPVHDEKAGLAASVAATSGRPKTVAERLAPTLETARAQRDRYAAKAKRTGRILSTAIGAQVLLGSLTTGLSALGAVKNNTALATTVLGALTTVVASYLARTRGSNEPELSITRVKDLEKFIRELEAYILDFGQYIGDEHDVKIAAFRTSFEEILGNNAEGFGDSKERRLSPPV
ncbi:hypothetical protein BKA70DRAFT_725242 [Coprinopsis sp. MPI-PUGE-AT-0042]|nr:hypothetical protein BKA70DRAFT_725242 [Coprinopsis sp. MPI-PUGE-AT-0042]